MTPPRSDGGTFPVRADSSLRFRRNLGTFGRRGPTPSNALKASRAGGGVVRTPDDRSTEEANRTATPLNFNTSNFLPGHQCRIFVIISFVLPKTIRKQNHAISSFSKTAMTYCYNIKNVELYYIIKTTRDRQIKQYYPPKK